MNLYRSFGNLMEAWMNEETRDSYSGPAAGSHDEDRQTPSSHMEAERRWESLDSGVETSSSDVSSTSPADNAESPGSHCLAQASPTPPPSPSGAQGVPVSLQQRVEQALQRTSSQHLEERQEPVTPATLLRRLSRTSPASRRSESFAHKGLEVRQGPSTRLVRQRPASMIVGKLPSQRKLEDLSEEEGRELSPGLSYLEQVCRTLEEFARQQIQSQAAVVQQEPAGDVEVREAKEEEEEACVAHHVSPRSPGCRSLMATRLRGWCLAALRPLNTPDDDLFPSRLRFQDPGGSPRDSPLPSDDVIVCSGHTLESDRALASCCEPQRRRDHQRHFRQRSVSDANLATLHLRELNASSRGKQRLRTDDLLLNLTDDFHKQKSNQEEKSSTVSRHWTFKIGSLKRESSTQSESKGQQTQPSEKSSTRRRLSQLFRRNQRKTQPA